MYTLTFDNEHLPQNFGGVVRALRAFLRIVRRWRVSCGREPALDYIYCVEGLHGDHRYHIHFICDYYDIAPAEMVPDKERGWKGLWRFGGVDMEYVLQPNRRVCLKNNQIVDVDRGGFRRIAEYLNKERTDGNIIPIGRHPWSCSRTLSAKLEPPERWKDTSGVIDVPRDAVWSRRGHAENDFGAYYFASWIVPARATNTESGAHAREQS